MPKEKLPFIVPIGGGAGITSDGRLVTGVTGRGRAISLNDGRVAMPDRDVFSRCESGGRYLPGAFMAVNGAPQESGGILWPSSKKPIIAKFRRRITTSVPHLNCFRYIISPRPNWYSSMQDDIVFGYYAANSFGYGGGGALRCDPDTSILLSYSDYQAKLSELAGQQYELVGEFNEDSFSGNTYPRFLTWDDWSNYSTRSQFINPEERGAIYLPTTNNTTSPLLATPAIAIFRITGGLYTHPALFDVNIVRISTQLTESEDHVASTRTYRVVFTVTCLGEEPCGNDPTNPLASPYYPRQYDEILFEITIPLRYRVEAWLGYGYGAFRDVPIVDDQTLVKISNDQLLHPGESLVTNQPQNGQVIQVNVGLHY